MLYGPADAVDFSRVKRALVVKLRHHGDVLLTSPVFSVLKAHASHLELDTLVYEDTAEMLSLHPSIHIVHTVRRAWRELPALPKLRREWQLWQSLKARRYDLLVHLSEHPRGAWLARTLGARASVAPAQLGRWWKTSFTHLYPLPRHGGRHQVELNLDALRRIGCYPGEGERRLVLVPGADAEAQADSLLAQHGIAPKQFIHLHPASRWRFKCWPAKQNAELADALAARGHRVVITAAPSAAEREMVDEIVALCASRPLDLAGRLTLKELAALTARARLFVGVDSAPMHIAAAMQTPSVALFGPSGENEWGPWRVPHRVMTANEYRCRPCGNDGCGGGKLSECLTTMPSKPVLDAALALL